MNWQKKLKRLHEWAKTQNKSVANDLELELYDYIILLEKVAASAIAMRDELARQDVELVDLGE